jgi:two-component system response regulator HydG
LDEIAEMALPLQAKLLHVLESGTVRALGSSKERPVDTRIVAATHRDLRERVSRGSFREDLLYRLDVITVQLPPLRHRKEDLPELIEHFLANAKARHPSSAVRRLSAEALARMQEYAWPGNVRELEHSIERLVLLGRGEEIAGSELPATMLNRRWAGASFDGDLLPLREIVRRYAQWAYEKTGGKKLATAEKLEIDFKTLNKLLQIEVDEGATLAGSSPPAEAR